MADKVLNLNKLLEINNGIIISKCAENPATAHTLDR